VYELSLTRWSSRKYIHCEDTIQSLLIYTEQQQRLCAYAATNIRHSHSYCEDTTQLLHIYTSVQRSKLIDFDFLIDLHASQSHTLQRHNTVFAHIHRMTATSLRMRCNSYTSYTYTAKTWFSFCTSTRLCNAVNWSNFRFIRLIYMHRNHIHCKDTTQSLLIYTERQQRLCACAATNIWHLHSHCESTIQLLRTYTSVQCSKSINFSVFWSIYMRCKYIDQNSSSSFSWVIIQQTWKLTSKWSAFIYIDQSLFSSHSLMIIQTSWKFTLKWSAFTILSCLYDHLII